LQAGRPFPESIEFSPALSRNFARRAAGGAVSGIAPAREEERRAGTNPETALDTRRLSEYSAEPENSHGA
jgi:hypothetical protein